MAIVRIKDAVVARVNRSGFGVQVKEADRTQGGKTFYGDRFTVWFKEPHNLSEGDTVSVSGFLGAKVGEPWTDREGNERVSVELSVNSPRLEEGTQDAPVSNATPAGWDSNEESPF